MLICIVRKATNRTRVIGTARQAKLSRRARRSTKNGATWSSACYLKEKSSSEQDSLRRPTRVSHGDRLFHLRRLPFRSSSKHCAAGPARARRTESPRGVQGLG